MWTAPGHRALLVLVGLADVEHERAGTHSAPRRPPRCRLRGSRSSSARGDSRKLAMRKAYREGQVFGQPRDETAATLRDQGRSL